MDAVAAVRPLVDMACKRPDFCAGCEAHDHGLCAPLKPVELADVSSAGERIAFAPREPLFRQGDAVSHIFILHGGTARLTQLLPDGRQASVGIRFGGDVLGFTPQSEHSLGAEALTDLVACRVARQDLERLFKRHAPLERHFLDLCARELSATQDQLVSLGRFTAEERVAAFLLSLADARERRGHRGPVYELPATRADIGELLGLTLETVSRIISEFRRRGWLRVSGPYTIELANRKALATIASGNANH